MPRQRSPERDKAFEIYKKHQGNIELIKISEQLSLPEGTVRGWKNKDKWNEQIGAKGTERSKQIRNVPKKGKNVPKVSKKTEIKFEDVDEGLTDKERLFCLYYIKNFNATIAALKAGYTKKYPSEIGYQLLRKPTVRREIERLKRIKAESIMLSADDIVERYMRIAFADMTDFVEFGRAEVPVMTAFGPLVVKNEETGEEQAITKEVNDLRFKESDVVDGGLICQIKQGRNGMSIKLEDRQKALDWLANYFELNPMDRHKKHYDEERLKLEREKLNQDQGKTPEQGVIIVDDIDE